ncbi:MAG: 2-C-methyl-D-erythritol 4-phosphate cytidylyltransferase, partial [Lachnospiraceae bacterium]|nr:2-C-methyl-D-erythritol 4-phosphate cytidylyltransferase [Lachnospiraceae bacterium]
MNIALVLSGGIGRRLASDVPKQYVTVNGKMIIIYTLQSLCAHEMIDAVHVVAARAWWEPMITELPDASKLKGFSEPGENRQYSIINGLKDISAYACESDVVLIQDGVRPCVSDDMISDVLNAVKGHDGAVPVLPLKDTVYLSEDG